MLNPHLVLAAVHADDSQDLGLKKTPTDLVREVQVAHFPSSHMPLCSMFKFFAAAFYLGCFLFFTRVRLHGV
jgi:hypothetical protein